MLCIRVRVREGERGWSTTIFGYSLILCEWSLVAAIFLYFYFYFLCLILCSFFVVCWYIIIILHIVTILSIRISFVICQQCRKSVSRETKNYHWNRYDTTRNRFKVESQRLEWNGETTTTKKKNVECHVRKRHTEQHTYDAYIYIEKSLHLNWSDGSMSFDRSKVEFRLWNSNRKPPPSSPFNIWTMRIRYILYVNFKTYLHLSS